MTPANLAGYLVAARSQLAVLSQELRPPHAGEVDWRAVADAGARLTEAATNAEQKANRRERTRRRRERSYA